MKAPSFMDGAFLLFRSTKCISGSGTGYAL